MERYKIELDEKVEILETILKNYDDRRRKSFYCIAVNLLPLQDVKAVMQQISIAIDLEMPLKEKAAAVVSLFEEIAEKRDISLRLRKKQSNYNP